MRNRTLLLLFFVGMIATSARAQFEGQSHYPRFNFNAGGGYGIGRGDVGQFVGNSFFGVGGAGMNFGRVFGFSGEYMYYDLGIGRTCARRRDCKARAETLQSFSLNGIVRSPYSLGKLGGYGIFGVGFYDRRVSSSSGTINALALSASHHGHGGMLTATTIPPTEHYYTMAQQELRLKLQDRWRI